MLQYLLLLLPCAVSMVFFFKFLIMKRTHPSHTLVLVLSLVSAVFFFADANYYSMYEDYPALMICDILAAYTAPALPALVMLLLRSIVFKKYVRWYSYVVLYILPCSLGAATLMTYVTLGTDTAVTYLRMMSEEYPSLLDVFNKERDMVLLYSVSVVAYYSITCVLSLLTLWQIGYYMCKTKFRWNEISRFLRGGGEIEPLHLLGVIFVCVFGVVVCRILVPRHCILECQGIAVAVSVIFATLLWIVFDVCTYVTEPTLTLRMLHGYDDTDVCVGETADGMGEHTSVFYEDLAEEDAASGKAYVSGATDSGLLDALDSYVAAYRPYLSPTLSIEELAAELCTNKTYLSKCINTNKHQTFRDYVNSLRIEYAKEKMLSHPELHQDETASVSGFAEASTFNRKFKQVVGATPRQWLLAHSS